MKSIRKGIKLIGLLLLALIIASCSSQSKVKESKQSAPLESDLSASASQQLAAKTLPVQYQKPSYMVDLDAVDDLTEDGDDVSLKVGANIVSTRGPQPLSDVMRILARAKGYSLSWASDVDRKILIDVNINADDDYHKSIANILRQVDYFHEMSDNTIVIKYKETRQFQIAMPFTTQNYSTGTGGNVLGSNDASTNVDGTIQLSSKNNEFDLWKNIKQNMDAIIRTWNTSTVEGKSADPAPGEATEENQAEAAMQVSSGNSMYIIDKPIGLITVTAPRPLLNRLDEYFTNLKRELYKQINIEAKIIEVRLENESNIGINWDEVLKGLSISGDMNLGSAAGNLIWPGSGSFVRSVSIDTINFDLFLNALKEQGDTNILSNPKISVMNGQPAMITVGKNVTYIDEVTADRDTDSGSVTYSVDTQRILSGVGLALTATILNDEEIIMNLVPVTSELEEPIEYEFTSDGGQVGLPVVKVREMNTTVRIKNGEMLVIGGLIGHTDDNDSSFAPGVGSIPVVKYLFGHEQKTRTKNELIVLLRPTIL